MMDPEQIKQPVILFDGVCSLCSNTVQFVIKRDKAKLFRFASLQSDFGQTILNDFRLPVDNFNSFILFQDQKVYIKSSGALKVAKHLSGFWPVLYILIIIPPFIRDRVYNIIAKNRYKWFGKKEACWLPSPELRSRFVD